MQVDDRVHYDIVVLLEMGQSLMHAIERWRKHRRAEALLSRIKQGRISASFLQERIRARRSVFLGGNCRYSRVPACY